MLYIFLNGNTIPEDEAHISIQDRGFLYGDGIFETIRAYNGHPFRLDAHLDRLFNSAKELNFTMNHTHNEIHLTVQNLLRINGLSDAYIRITLSRGHTHPTLLIVTRPLTPYPQEYYKHGIAVIVSNNKTRISTSWPLTAHKTLNFMNNTMAREGAKALGAQEVLFLNTDAHVAECSVSNLFLVSDSEVITPSLNANILPGITRMAVLEICRRDGIAAREALFGLETLMGADEVFLTNSLMEVMPVSTLDSRPLTRPVPGKITSHVMEAYRNLALNEKTTFPKNDDEGGTGSC